jgi:hypothetical protein
MWFKWWMDGSTSGRYGSIVGKGCSFRRGDGSITVMEEMV